MEIALYLYLIVAQVLVLIYLLLKIKDQELYLKSLNSENIQLKDKSTLLEKQVIEYQKLIVEIKILLRKL